MIVARPGNKRVIAPIITGHFPPHKVYIETFFGAGGLFFYKKLVKNNVVNDLSSDVYNLFMVVMNRKQELINAFDLLPIHIGLLKYWYKNEETEPIKKALRFMFLSNFTYLGGGETLAFKLRDVPKEKFYKYIDKTFIMLKNVKFNNQDFRDFFKNLSYTDVDYGKPSHERKNTLIYNDPPYLHTNNKYKTGDWGENDVIDLIDCNIKSGCNFVYSEYNHPFILEQAKERNLNLIIIGEKRSIKTRKTEIILTNYDLGQKELF